MRFVQGNGRRPLDAAIHDLIAPERPRPPRRPWADVARHPASVPMLLVALASMIAGGACSVETQDYPPTGSSTGGAGGAGGSGGGPPCTTPDDCTEDENPCTRAVCVAGRCENVADDDLTPPDDGDECTRDTCEKGLVKPVNEDNDTPCGNAPGKTRCKNGICVGCNAKEDCLADTPCRTWECTNNHQCLYTNGSSDPDFDPPGDCTKRSCTEAGALVAEEDPTDKPVDDDNPCTKEMCQSDGTPLVMELPAGTVCGEPKSCEDGVATGADLCNADAVCELGAVEACGPYNCSAATQECLKSCTPGTQKDDCAEGHYCAGSSCIPKSVTGARCAVADECQSGFCADSVCCEEQCTGACKSCDLAGGRPGNCVPLPKGLVDECQAGSACNLGTCTPLGIKKAVGEPCDADNDCLNMSCLLGLCRLSPGQDCTAATTSASCASNLCAEGMCASCAVDADCPLGLCNQATSRCLLPAGEACGSDEDCLSTGCSVAHECN